MEAIPRGREYTVVLIGDPASRVRRYHLRTRTLARVAAACAAVTVAAAGALALHLRHDAVVRATRGDASATREENTRLRERLRAFEERVAHISATLDRVAQADAALRETARRLQPGGAAPTPARSEPPASPLLTPEPGGALRSPSALPGDVTGALGGPVRDMPDVEARLGGLDRAAAGQESSLRGFREYFEAQRALLATTPAAWPARGFVTSDFGERLDPYTAERMMHRGLDIASRPGDPVLAPSDAVVKFAGTEPGYGNVLVLDHGHGVDTRYGHLSAIYVKKGERVKRGARVAAVGSTGRSTGPHLHYEVRVNGAAENPRKFLTE